MTPGALRPRALPVAGDYKPSPTPPTYTVTPLVDASMPISVKPMLKWPLNRLNVMSSVPDAPTLMPAPNDE